MNGSALRSSVSPWPPVLVAAGLLLAAVLILYRDTALAMVGIWSRSDTFAHAFTVPPIVVWLIWRKRQELATRIPRASVWALLPIAVASAAWLLGDLAASNAVAQLAFTALLVLVVVAMIGVRASRVIAFPLAFLFFSVPVGEFVMPQMMQWTADFTVLALRLSGIPVYREGLQFVIPSGNWSVVEACSGIRYLMASAMVGVLFAYLNFRTLSRRLTFSLVSVVVPIVANWARAYLIVLLGHLSGNKLATGTDHLIYGWLFFGVVITLMFLIGVRWTEPPVAAASAPIRTASIPTREASARRSNSLMYAVAIGAVVLLVLPHLAFQAVASGERPGAPALAAPSTLADGWRLAEGSTAPWRPAFQGAAAEFNQQYEGGQGQVGLYVGYYRHQDYAQKLVTSENRIVTSRDAEWSVIESGTRELVVDGAPMEFRTALLRGSNHVSAETSTRLVVWEIYWVDGTLTPSDTWAKICTAYYRILGRGDDAAAIVLYADGSQGAPGSARLESFVRSNMPALKKLLARTRQGAAGSAGP